MTVPEIRKVMDTWADQMVELGPKFKWVQVGAVKLSLVKSRCQTEQAREDNCGADAAC